MSGQFAGHRPIRPSSFIATTVINAPKATHAPMALSKKGFRQKSEDQDDRHGEENAHPRGVPAIRPRTLPPSVSKRERPADPAHLVNASSRGSHDCHATPLDTDVVTVDPIVVQERFEKTLHFLPNARPRTFDAGE